jgi:serine/threonine-protein kinase HipA
MEDQLQVCVSLDGHTHAVGNLWTHSKGQRESASFEYDRAWLANPLRFSIDPALTLYPGVFHTGANAPMFGAIGDSSPDRWGRALMRRAERRRAEAAKTTPRALREIDFLLQIDDETRMGALRFRRHSDAPFLAESQPHRVPPLVALPLLLNASNRIEQDKDTAADINLLLAPGSSLGGARPKSTIREKDGSLAIAKFPSHADDWDTIRWESVALTLAQKSGLRTAKFRLETIKSRPVLMLTRFDRAATKQGPIRIPFLSAMSMMGARDGETRSYLEIADLLRQHGATPKADLEELWRRIAFHIHIANLDDHLRNHAFLWTGPRGWTLSPAYDLNPVPADVRPRILSTNINEDDATASMDLASSVAADFGLKPDRAKAITAKIRRAVKAWRTIAQQHNIPARQIDRMSSAFEIT